MRRLATGLLVVALTSIASSASADMIAYRFEGVIDSVGPSLGQVKVGDPWTLTLEWMVGPQEGGRCTANGCYYSRGGYGGMGTLGEFEFGIFGMFEIGVETTQTYISVDDVFTPAIGPRLGNNLQFEPAYADLDVWWNTLAGQDPYPPSDIPDQVMSDLLITYGRFGPGGAESENFLEREEIRGHVTKATKVPTPSTLMLTLMGLGGLIVRRRRRAS